MPKKTLEILGVKVQEDIAKISENNASVGVLEGFLAERKNYILNDSKGRFNFIGNGLFSRNNFIDAEINEIDEDSGQLFNGLIRDVSLRRDITFYTDIKATSVTTSLLDYTVETNDGTTHAGFQVDGNVPKGSTTIPLKTGLTEIPSPSQLSFSDFLIPRYTVISSVGNPTTSVVLNRPLEADLADNDSVFVSVPVFKTFPAEIRDAILTLDALAFPSSNILAKRLGSSFDILDQQDQFDGYIVWLHILREMGIEFKNHLSLMLEMSDSRLTISESGIIDIVRGKAWKGNAIADRIIPSDIIANSQYSFKSVRDKLVIGYDCLYFDSANQVIKPAQGDVDQSLIDAYHGKNRWVPIGVRGQGDSVTDYPVLYGNAQSADYFGQRRIEYYGYPRIQFTASIKRSKFGKPSRRNKFQLFKEFLLTAPISSNGQKIVDNPVSIEEFSYDDNQMSFPVVRMELINRPSPNIPLNVESFSDRVNIINVLGFSNGLQIELDPFEGQLCAEVYYEDKKYLVTEKIAQVTTGATYLATVLSNLIQPGVSYFVRVYSCTPSCHGKKTDFFSFFTPASDGGFVFKDGNNFVFKDGNNFVFKE